MCIRAAVVPPAIWNIQHVTRTEGDHMSPCLGEAGTVPDLRCGHPPWSNDRMGALQGMDTSGCSRQVGTELSSSCPAPD